MIRPEAAARLARWREALAGAASLLAGLWLTATSSGLPALFGWVLLGGGAFMLVSGIRRARFHREVEAPGVVEVDEGRITYLGPVIGGAVALDDLQQIVFRRTSTADAFWRLIPSEGRPLIIPEGAHGVDALLDAFAPLPGFDGGAMVRAVQSRTEATHLV
ncbi:MAG: hypothetical protein AAGK57_13810, partial [Pseudomonadota bacterium]